MSSMLLLLFKENIYNLTIYLKENTCNGLSLKTTWKSWNESTLLHTQNITSSLGVRAVFGPLGYKQPHKWSADTA